MRKQETVANILVGSFILVVVVGVGYLMHVANYNHALEMQAKSFAKQTLRTEVDGSMVYWDVKFTSDFERGEYGNTATVTYLDKTVEKHDINKSRIAGEWVGQKTKEGIKGVFRGIFKNPNMRVDRRSFSCIIKDTTLRGGQVWSKSPVS